MNSKIFILKISDIMELGCRFLVQYICREMLINANEVFCRFVPVCIKIGDGRARCGLGATRCGLGTYENLVFLFVLKSTI